MESERGSWTEEAFTKQGVSYVSYVNTDGPMEFRITPREGYFDVEVSETTHEYEYEHDVIDGISVSYPVYDEIDEMEHLNSRELTVCNVETAVQRAILDPEWTLPEDLAKKLIDWQEKYWDGNEIEKGYVPEGVAAPEDISERLGPEFDSALAEAQGIAVYESLTLEERQDVIQSARELDDWMESEAITKYERASLEDNQNAQEQSVELEDGEDHSFSF